MIELLKYSEELIKRAKEHLSKEYNLAGFNIPDFQSINFYLIDKALEANKNLFIKPIHAEQNNLIYVPSVLSVAISLFFKNFCDDKTSYNIGEILQKDGIRFEIIAMTNYGYKLRTNCQGGYTSEIDKERIKKYIVTNADLSKRKVKNRFDDYKKFFQLVFGVDSFPSKFHYKAAIILEKKDFEEELKLQEYTDIQLLQAIPLQWITKTGTESPYIPIEPMIYLAPDYETFTEFVLEKGKRIEAVILIGKNKYKENTLFNLKRDLREEKIPNAIIIGNEDIEDKENRFLKWNWTYPEYAYLSNAPISVLNPVEIEETNYIEAIRSYFLFISEVEKQFSVNLHSLGRFKMFLFSLVLPLDKGSRLLNYVDWLKHLFIKVTTSTISEELSNQNENPQIYINESKILIENIFKAFTNSKLSVLSSVGNIDILLVPNYSSYQLGIWSSEFHNDVQYHTLKSFLDNQSTYQTVNKVILLSLYGYGISPTELIVSLSNTCHNYSILCYPEEKILLQSILNSHFNNLRAEYQSAQRKTLTNIEFHIMPKPVAVSDIIEELNSRTEKERTVFDYEMSEQVNYLLTFEESIESIVCEGSKMILLNPEKRKEQVSHLRPGDEIRIYSNVDKHVLFDIALREDKEGRFKIIDRDSKTWKSALSKYYQSKVNLDTSFDGDALLKELRTKGLTISNSSTVRKWMNVKDKEKFPNALHNLLAIKSLISNDELNLRFDSVRKSRRLFRSIMIVLGRDLSDEVMDYVISEGKVKGKILSRFSDDEINSFINQAAPLRKIKSISITEEEDETNRS